MSLAIGPGRHALRQLTDTDQVPHLTPDQVWELVKAAQLEGNNGYRDALFIRFVFDSCLRVSEACRVRPVDLAETPDGWLVSIVGKGGKMGEAAVSPSTVSALHQYGYSISLPFGSHFFPFSRSRAFQIVARAFNVSGVRKPEHVGAVHVLRHSGLLARLGATGNPKAVQDQARHKSFNMTMRYFKTLQIAESLRIQQGVDPWRQ